jgi:hypothetical protein
MTAYLGRRSRKMLVTVRRLIPPAPLGQKTNHSLLHEQIFVLE